jgi:hypothetical protein
MIRVFNRQAVALVLIISNLFAVSAAAELTSVDSSQAIVKLTDEILFKEIEMERFYLKYKIIANEEPKLRETRYFIGQQASLGLFLAGDVVGLADSGQHLSTPSKVSIGGLKEAVTTELVGSAIGGASSAIELCSNAMIARKNKKRGQNPGSAVLHMETELKEVRNLLSARMELVRQQKSSPAYDIYLTESELLQDYCDWCVYEFAKIYADVKSYQAGSNVYYLLNTTSNTIYCVGGSLALKAFNNSQYTSSSIITGIIGDGISVISAPVGLFAQKSLKKYHFKKISKKLSVKPYDVEAVGDYWLDRFHKVVSNASERTRQLAGHLDLRLAAYDLWDQRYDEFMSKETTQLRRHDKIALQSGVYGPVISGTFLSQDILGAAAWYGNKDRPKTANNLVFAGFIAPAVGSALGLTASAWYYLDEYLNKKKLKREGDMPEQLLQKRLKTLDEIEDMIRVP